MAIADPHAAAAILYEARRTGTPVEPFTDNDPLNAVAWLANTLGEHGIALEPGHLVMTGALHAAAPMAVGDVFRAEFDRLGPVTVRVTEGT